MCVPSSSAEYAETKGTERKSETQYTGDLHIKLHDKRFILTLPEMAIKLFLRMHVTITISYL